MVRVPSLILFLAGLSAAWASAEPEEGSILTVMGAISPLELGRTLPHEHILVDFIGATETGYHRWDRQTVIAKVQPFLEEARGLGYTALVECTPAYIGRDPRLLRRLAERTGLHLLTNTGYYGARDNSFLPPHAFEETPEQLAARWTAEFFHGIEDTSIRPGFIKIGVDRGDVVSELQQKLVRAAALTHLKTGLTIVSHTGPTDAAFHQLEILQEMGVAPEAFVWTHATWAPLEKLIEAGRRGAWLSLDNVPDNPRRHDQLVTSLLGLRQADLLHRVLLSHDAGWYRPGEPDGGNFRPYTAISAALIPKLRAAGFTDADLDQMEITNPAEAFTLRLRPH